MIGDSLPPTQGRSPYPLGLAIAILFVAAGAFLERSERFSGLRSALRRRSVPAPLLDRGSLGDVLRAEGLLLSRPAADGGAGDPTRQDESASPFALRTAEDGEVYEANPDRSPSLLDARLPPGFSFPKDVPVVSVAAWPEDLYGPRRGLVTHPEADWERRVDVALYRAGRLRLRTGAGLKLQGLSTRDPRHPLNRSTNRRSFRLMFRSRYGLDAVPGEAVFDRYEGLLRALVLRRNRGVFAHALALDIARRVGAEAPAGTVGLFVLNGEPQGFYILNEHVSARQWRERRGGDRVLLFRRRSRSDAASWHAHGRLSLWAEEHAGGLSLAEAARFVDVDSLLAYLFTVAFCGTRDWEQAGLVLDLDDPTDRWRFIPWDLDGSFLDVRLSADAPPWHKPGFGFVLDEPSEARVSVAARLFRALLVDSAFRTRLREFCDGALKRLDPEWMGQRLTYYRRFVALPDGRTPAPFARLEAFVAGREPFLRQELRTLLAGGSD